MGVVRTLTPSHQQATSDGIKNQASVGIVGQDGLPAIKGPIHYVHSLSPRSDELSQKSQAGNPLFPKMFSIKMIDSGNM